LAAAFIKVVEDRQGLMIACLEEIAFRMNLISADQLEKAAAVFDVAVDIRRSSPFFGQWSGVMLTGDNHYLLWVPPGFAHGFYVISAKADLVYKCTDFYAPAHVQRPKQNHHMAASGHRSGALAPRRCRSAGWFSRSVT
jgi:dTDP-4-dehydrorhamnose 3,5-epimerase